MTRRKRSRRREDAENGAKASTKIRLLTSAATKFSENLGTVVFDPDEFNPPLDADRDGVYHFSAISIGSGTEVYLRADVLGHKPVIWLASGDVEIKELLGLSVWQMGSNDPRVPGAGGFAGGSINGIQNGQGPGGSPVSQTGTDQSTEYSTIS